MPFKIRPKRTGTAGKRPTAAQLDVGEIALNMVDRKLYFKDAANAIKELDGSIVAQQPTNLGISRAVSQITVTSSTGNNAVIPGAGAQAGIMTKAHVDKLNKAATDIIAINNKANAAQTAANKAQADTNALKAEHHDLGLAVGHLAEELLIFANEFDVVHATLQELRNLINNIPTAPPTPPVGDLTASVGATAKGMTGNKSTTVKYTTEHSSYSGMLSISLSGAGPLTGFSVTNTGAGFTLRSAGINRVTYRDATGKVTSDGTYRNCSTTTAGAVSFTPIGDHPTYGKPTGVSLMFTFRK